MLTHDQRKQLLQIARQSIEAGLSGGPAPDLTTLDDDLRRPAGAFVTLHTAGGDLRGCIGTIQAVAPLCEAVAANARNAAFRDPRFTPLRAEELKGLHIEISVMGPVETVEDVSSIEVGRDGLIISQGGRTGLLLPQVASERGWDRVMFLTQTCVKAGLSGDAWRAPACRIEKFSAEAFGELNNRKESA